MHPKTDGRVLTQKGAAAQSPYTMVGLVAGTLILTKDGALPIEFLTHGDRVISRAHGLVTLTDFEARTETLPMVKVYPGALGPNRPEFPTLMPASQHVLLRDARVKQFSGASQVVVPVGCLVDDATILDLGQRETRLFRLSFERPEIIYADGIEVSIAAPRIAVSKAA